MNWPGVGRVVECRPKNRPIRTNACSTGRSVNNTSAHPSPLSPYISTAIKIYFFCARLAQPIYLRNQPIMTSHPSIPVLHPLPLPLLFLTSPLIPSTMLVCLLLLHFMSKFYEILNLCTKFTFLFTDILLNNFDLDLRLGGDTPSIPVFEKNTALCTPCTTFFFINSQQSLRFHCRR
jgi:hypothetical protein